MVQPALRILSPADASQAARRLETPDEVSQFEALGRESGSVRAFMDTPEWTAIRERIVGNGRPAGRPVTLADVSRLLRYTADDVTGPAQRAYLHAAMEVESFARSLRPQPAPPAGAPGQTPESLSFGEAMQALKRGKLMRRASWASEVYVVMQPGYPDGVAVNANTAAATGLPLGSTAVFGPYLLKRLPANGDGPPQFELGWTPGTQDLFAGDWQIAAGA